MNVTINGRIYIVGENSMKKLIYTVMFIVILLPLLVGFSSNSSTDLTTIPNIKTSTGDAEQVIVVLADRYGTIKSTCLTYEKSNGNWHMVTQGEAVTGINGFSDNRKQGDLTSPTGKYRIPFLFITGMSVTEIIVMLILQSKFGILLMLVVFVIQLLVFVKYMSQDELKRVLLAFKGD